jgi:hypothetical protein
VLHEAWLATVSCPVIRLEGDLSPDEQLGKFQMSLERARYAEAEGGQAHV